jgi:hypothetical protein
VAPDPRYLLLDKTPVVIFNVQMMKFFAAFFYFSSSLGARTRA